jgi:hypothetical protein
MRQSTRDRWLAPALCALFILQGWIFIPYPGIQNDEALFAAGLYPPVWVEHGISVFHRMVPTMLMNYLGGLKIWIYGAIFAVWPPSAYSFRVPPLLIGALTVWLFYVLMRRGVGRPAALAATALLATDTTWILTTTLDWGPVALQHLLLIAGALLIYRFDESGRPAELGAGFFLFGLGLWDKALFAWPLAGLGAAALAVYPRRFVARTTPRNVVIAGLCFAAGAAPLLIYNLRRDLATFRGNATYSAENFGHKLGVVRSGLDGDSMFGYLVRNQPEPVEGRPRDAVERVSLALSEAGGARRQGLMFLALAVSILLLPVLWRTPEFRASLFAIVFLAAGWLQMALTKDAGYGTHHTALLWPFPHFLVGTVLAGATQRLGRPGAAALVLIVVLVGGSSVLVTNEHLAQFVRHGSSLIWTDAIYPLSEYLDTTRPSQIYVMDWGMLNSLRALNQGRLPLAVGSDPVADGDVNETERQMIERMLADSKAIYVGHTDGNEIFAGVDERMQQFGRAGGYRKDVIKTVSDRRGRPIFEVYRYLPAAAPRS